LVTDLYDQGVGDDDVRAIVAELQQRGVNDNVLAPLATRSGMPGHGPNDKMVSVAAHSGMVANVATRHDICGEKSGKCCDIFKKNLRCVRNCAHTDTNE
jgi:hypothetical protein